MCYVWQKRLYWTCFFECQSFLKLSDESLQWFNSLHKIKVSLTSLQCFLNLPVPATNLSDKQTKDLRLLLLYAKQYHYCTFEFRLNCEQPWCFIKATPYYNLLGILKFQNVYKLKVALFTHKIPNGSTNISTIFHRSLTRASEIHTYNIRFASKLNFHRPIANNNYGTSSFAFVSSQLWETIPTNIKRLPYTSFCNQYKLYLLNMQSSEQPVY